MNKFSAQNFIDRVEFLLEHPELSLRPEDIEDIKNDEVDPGVLAEKIARNLPKFTEELIADCDKAIAIEGDNDTAHYLHGTLLATKGKYKESIASLTRALELAPMKAEYYKARADVHETFGHDEESEADLDRAADLNDLD